MFKMRARAKAANTQEAAAPTVESTPKLEAETVQEEVVEEAPAIKAPKTARVSQATTKKSKSKKL
tara:strand:+ start:646 stop:840 length:195 start_codon:yes stop_codon:yes gene_type:complete